VLSQKNKNRIASGDLWLLLRLANGRLSFQLA
jgi:hypothetical protein